MSVLYRSWILLRSIMEPSKFKDELLIKWPRTVMNSIWVIGFAIWIPITIGFGVEEYSLDIDYHPHYMNKIFNFFFWFLPLIGITILSIKIVWLLNLRSIRKLGLVNKLHLTTKNTVSDLTLSTDQTQKTTNTSQIP